MPPVTRKGGQVCRIRKPGVFSTYLGGRIALCTKKKLSKGSQRGYMVGLLQPPQLPRSLGRQKSSIFVTLPYSTKPRRRNQKNLRNFFGNPNKKKARQRLLYRRADNPRSAHRRHERTNRSEEHLFSSRAGSVLLSGKLIKEITEQGGTSTVGETTICVAGTNRLPSTASNLLQRAVQRS